MVLLGLSHNPGSAEHCLKCKETTSGDTVSIFHCFPMTGGRFRPSQHCCTTRRWLQSLRKPQDQSLQQPCNSNRCILHPRKTTKHGPFFRFAFFFFWGGGCKMMDAKIFWEKNVVESILRPKFLEMIYFDVFFSPVPDRQLLSRPKWMPMRRRLPTILMQDPAGSNASTSTRLQPKH